MFLRDAPRPASGERISERFGFADAFEELAQHRFDEIQNSDRNTAVGLDPIPKIFSEFRLENSEPLNFL